MVVNNNPVQDYIEELNKTEIPVSEINILDFLSSLNSQHQKEYLSFILSQSHIFDSMKRIMDAQTYVSFYSSSYSDYESVPMINKEDGKIQYVELASLYSTSKKCKTVLDSLQGDDKTEWMRFVQYVKSIYEANKMNINFNPTMKRLYEEYLQDITSLKAKVFQKNAKEEVPERDNNNTDIKEKGIINRIKDFFSKEKKNKSEELILQDDNTSPRELALALIKKYKGNSNLPMLMRNQLDYAESLISADLPDYDFKKVIIGLDYCKNETLYGINTIFNMLKQLSANAQIGKKLYSPEILYAQSFQNMTKKIRILLSASELKENVDITGEYRSRPLKNQFMTVGDVSDVLKGKDLSKEQIQTKMCEYDNEFEEALHEKNPEKYVRRCTDLMMKFISTHPFDDGNGRTSRMLLQAMLGRRGLLFSSNINNYFERQSNSNYSRMEGRCLATGDYKEMEDYILERLKDFNGGKIELYDEQLKFENKGNEKDLVKDISR